MNDDPHASSRDRKLRRRRAFVPDNRRSVRGLQRILEKGNKPRRGGIREIVVGEPKNG